MGVAFPVYNLIKGIAFSCDNYTTKHSMKNVRVLGISNETQSTRWDALLNPLELQIDTTSKAEVMATPELASNYEIIIIDTDNPQDDIALCKLLRPLHTGFILVLGTDANEPDVLAAYAAGADDWIVKRPPNVLLRAKINAWSQRIEQVRRCNS